MTLSQIPNIITVIRILLVVPTAWLLWEMRYVDALILMSIAGASDALDGWLARRFRWTSKFGAAMDPIADKLLVAVLFVVFTIQGHIPLWVAIIVLTRDSVIMVGAGIYPLLFERISLEPTFVSKANTAMQIIMLLMLLLSFCGFGWLSDLSGRLVDPFLFYVLAVLGVSSGIDYVITWGQRAWKKGRLDRGAHN